MLVFLEKIAETVILSAILTIVSVISYLDFKTKKIPDPCIFGLMLCGGAVHLLWPTHGLLNHAAGFFAVSVPMALCTAYFPGSFGGGDIKMMAAAGFLLGIPDVYRAFCKAILSAGGFALCLCIFKGRKAKIPLGPFLCLGILSETSKLWRFAPEIMTFFVDMKSALC